MDKFTPEDKTKIARILYDAFDYKIAYVWLFTKSKDEAVQLIAHGMNTEQLCVEMVDGEIAGVLGYELSNKTPFINLSYRACREVFGFFGGAFRFLAYKIYKMSQVNIAKNEVHLDLIAVSQDHRGAGVGSRLLEAVDTITRKNNRDTVVLEVVNSNPRAKELYKRYGYREEEFNTIPFPVNILTRKANFDGFYAMKKKL